LGKKKLATGSNMQLRNRLSLENITMNVSAYSLIIPFLISSST